MLGRGVFGGGGGGGGGEEDGSLVFTPNCWGPQSNQKILYTRFYFYLFIIYLFIYLFIYIFGFFWCIGD
jgi:hypothetical protein